VDKVVDKDLLTARKASSDAGSNKMPVPQALFLPNKINDLQRRVQVAEFIFRRFLKIFFVYNFAARAPTNTFDKTSWLA
jgi:hypothetical protein